MSNKRISPQIRKTIKEQAKYCCEYCLSQEEFSPDTFSIEHIVPRAKDGTNQPDNLAHACQGCNNHKHTSTDAIDPLVGEIVSLYHPRRDNWDDHFGWNEDCTLMLGLTSTGRATIDKLNLNRKGVVNLRSVLHKLDLHPPK